MKMKFSLIAASSAAVALLASCAHDVPVPDDQQARDWTPKIKNSYSSWQPPKQMPRGNPEYEAAFSRAPAAPKQALPPPSAFDEIPAPAAKAPLRSPEQTVRMEIVGPAPNSCRVNGDILPDEMTESFLLDCVAANPQSHAVIIWTGRKDAARGEYFAKFCRDNGFVSVDTKEYALPPASPAHRSSVRRAGTHAPAAAARRVVDRSVPGTTYTVKSGDSLSGIAKKQYHDGNLWQVIYRENKTALKQNANKLKPGMRLVIPALKPAGSK